MALAPTSLDEATAAVRDSGAAGQSLLVRGGGTKLDWGGRVEADAELDTRKLDRLIAHNAGDMTAEVGAGMALARLQEELAGAGQWLALDPPLTDEGATVGGIMAAADAGPRRLRYGAVRDLVIGTTVVLADGTVARSGGHVIKNVAGYDVAKLLCGSLGTLGLIAEVVVRLHPLPAASRTVRVRADAQAASALALDLAASPTEPTAVEWSSDGMLTVRVEGGEAGVAAQAPRVVELAGRRGLDAEVVEGDQEAAVWRELAVATAGDDGQTVARAGTLPDRLPLVAAALRQAGDDTGTEVTLVSSACLGSHTAWVAGADAAAHADVVTRWRRAVEAAGGRVTLRRRLDGVDELVDPWGAPPSALALMRRVKRQLDPDDRCAPGRFGSWLEREVAG
jgi:glycolate dehydrogenase FAD-binding subunit